MASITQDPSDYLFKRYKLEILWKRSDKVVIEGLDNVAKEVAWTLISGSPLGIVSEESVNLGELSSHFHRNYGPNNHSVQLRNASAESPLEV